MTKAFAIVCAVFMVLFFIWAFTVQTIKDTVLNRDFYAATVLEQSFLDEFLPKTAEALAGNRSSSFFPAELPLSQEDRLTVLNSFLEPEWFGREANHIVNGFFDWYEAGEGDLYLAIDLGPQKEVLSQLIAEITTKQIIAMPECSAAELEIFSAEALAGQTGSLSCKPPGYDEQQIVSLINESEGGLGGVGEFLPDQIELVGPAQDEQATAAEEDGEEADLQEALSTVRQYTREITKFYWLYWVIVGGLAMAIVSLRLKNTVSMLRILGIPLIIAGSLIVTYVFPLMAISNGSYSSLDLFSAGSGLEAGSSTIYDQLAIMLINQVVPKIIIYPLVFGGAAFGLGLTLVIIATLKAKKPQTVSSVT